jgi:hypothetical protein
MDTPWVKNLVLALATRTIGFDSHVLNGSKMVYPSFGIEVF